jgi:hypothetical protein
VGGWREGGGERCHGSLLRKCACGSGMARVLATPRRLCMHSPQCSSAVYACARSGQAMYSHQRQAGALATCISCSRPVVHSAHSLVLKA